MNRWIAQKLLRISMRQFLVGIALLCAYLACWKPTQSRGLRDVEQHVYGRRVPNSWIFGINASSRLPLIVGIDESRPPELHRCYYFWLFGFVAKLPFERTAEWDDVHWPRLVRTGMTKEEVKILLGTPDTIVGDDRWNYREHGTVDFDDQERVAQIRK